MHAATVDYDASVISAEISLNSFLMSESNGENKYL